MYGKNEKIMKTLLENWRELKEKARGPADFHYKGIDSPLKKEIQVLDLRNKQPLPGKAKGDAKIVIEKRTDVSHWQVTWSNSPKGTEGIGTIMYLMAMELAGNEGFSPDDYEQSDDALRVWAKFMPKDNIFITGTTDGEVKLWASLECIPLGTMNSENWDGARIKQYISDVTEQTKGW